MASWLSAGGVLAEEEALSVTVPADVKLTAFLVENGAAVREGDPIASVDRVTVMAAIASVQESMEDLAVQLDKAGNHSAYEQVMAAVSDFEKGNMRLSMVLASLDVK